MKMYIYDRCGTCVRAKKYLDAKGIEYKAIPIRETPPTLSELNKMLKFYKGDIKKLFNTSGLDYKSMKMKDKIPKYSTEKLLGLLSTNGNLVKRPFVISKEFLTVGFKEELWEGSL